MNRFLASVCCVLTLAFVGLSNAVYAMPPAPPVGDVRVIETYIGEDGYVYVDVKVEGYGRSFSAKYDNKNVKCISDRTIESAGRMVTGFIYTFKCSPAKAGHYRFTFSITTTNWRMGEIGVGATITVHPDHTCTFF